MENIWGTDWGTDGYVKVLASDKSTGLDYYAMGVAVYPYTLAEYYAMQDQMQRGKEETGKVEGGEEINLDLDKQTEKNE